MNARPATTCVQCKTAPAVAFGFFADLGVAAHGLPWCESCMGQLVPVLLHQGFPINLVSANKPPSLQLCEYGEDCPKLCRTGWRVCDDHREELREVYAGKESGASVDQCPTCKSPDPAAKPVVDTGSRLEFHCDDRWHNAGVMFELMAPPASTRGGYDR